MEASEGLGHTGEGLSPSQPPNLPLLCKRLGVDHSGVFQLPSENHDTKKINKKRKKKKITI